MKITRTERPMYEGPVQGARKSFRGKDVKRVERACGKCHAIDGTPCCYWQPSCKDKRWKDPIKYNPDAKEHWCDRCQTDWCGMGQDGHEYCFVEAE